MKVTIEPRTLGGRIAAIPSKSHVHRLLICWALGDSEVFLPVGAVSQDMEATARCMNALGADIGFSSGGLNVLPIRGRHSGSVLLDCGESGSTYRFLVPLVCALGLEATFRLSGKLPSRPMDELQSVLEAHGAVIRGKGTPNPYVSGPITSGVYEIAGNVSSQYISGLLFALPLLQGDSEIVIKGETQSIGYIRMTLDVLKDFRITVVPTPSGYRIPGGQKYRSPEALFPEGDWSNAAFWLCAAAAGGRAITIAGLNPDSSQGDSRICDILRRFGATVDICGRAVTVKPGPLHGTNIDAGNIPDLVPAIAVAAAAADGTTVIENTGRLRLKESDRIKTVCGTLNALGGEAGADDNTITIRGKGGLAGGAADGCGDHRIAMMAAVASVICRDPVIVTNAEAVNKSYPSFFEDFTALGGCIIRGDEGQ